MIYKNGKPTVAIYHNGKAVVVVYKGTRKVWELETALMSCFANGYWIDDNPWTDEYPWKDDVK